MNGRRSAAVPSAVPKPAATLIFLVGSLAAGAALGGPPRTPKGLPACTTPLAPQSSVVSPGDELVYEVEILGLGVGALRLGARRVGPEVTETRARMEPRALLGSLFRVEGQASSLSRADANAPTQAHLAYAFRSQRYLERQALFRDGRVSAERTKDGKARAYEREVGGPAVDFLGALALAPLLPTSGESCALLVHDGRAYTAWASYARREKVEALERKVRADRYEVRYASEKGKKVERLTVWVSASAPRVVVRAESDAALAPVFVLRELRVVPSL